MFSAAFHAMGDRDTTPLIIIFLSLWKMLSTEWRKEELFIINFEGIQEDFKLQVNKKIKNFNKRGTPT